VGRAAFRHFTLAVDDRVLIPRQETELLVDLVLEARRTSPGGIAADIGTGSGAIALALAAEGAFDRVIGSDIAVGAIDLARANAASIRPQIRAPLEFRVGAGLGALGGETVDVVVSNPPYIAFDETRVLPSSVRDWEPPYALLSGENGLAFTREIVRGAPAYLHSGGLLALEVDARRASLVAEMVACGSDFRSVRVHRDLTGRDRFVLATRCGRKVGEAPLTSDL
jgi:release factor glutamine methyltransferase